MVRDATKGILWCCFCAGLHCAGRAGVDERGEWGAADISVLWRVVTWTSGLLVSGATKEHRCSKEQSAWAPVTTVMGGVLRPSGAAGASLFNLQREAPVSRSRRSRLEGSNFYLPQLSVSFRQINAGPI